MYIATAMPICLLLDRQVVARAFSRAWAKTGNRIAARMAIIAITTRSSINVKPNRLRDGRSNIGNGSFLSNPGWPFRGNDWVPCGCPGTGRITGRPAAGYHGAGGAIPATPRELV